MKKLVLNISESTYEKFCFEAIKEQKNIQQIIKDRIFYKPFNTDIEDAFEKWLDSEVEKIVGGE